MLFSRRQLLGLFIGLGLGASALPSGVAKRARLRIGAISDLNSSYGSTSYIESVHKGIRQLIALQPDLIVCAGDMVAGQKRGLTDDQLDAMWSGFNESIVQPLQIERIPLLPALGNHDASPDFLQIKRQFADFGLQSALSWVCSFWMLLVFPFDTRCCKMEYSGLYGMPAQPTSQVKM